MSLHCATLWRSSHSSDTHPTATQTTHWHPLQKDGFKSLKEGEAVTFVAEQGQKGMQASSVRNN
jgi:hypothetical protein